MIRDVLREGRDGWRVSEEGRPFVSYLSKPFRFRATVVEEYNPWPHREEKNPVSLQQ